MHLKKKMVVFVFVFAMIAAACGGSTATTTTAAAPTGGDTTSTAAPAPTTTTTSGPTTTVAPPAEEIAMDFGVTDTEIRIGLLADLTGPFAGLTVDIVDAQLAYWENVVNANGGIAGRMVVPVVEDTAYDVVQHGEKYAKIIDQVVAFSNSTGSPHTASILDKVKEDNVLVIPLSWYSGWADPAFDGGLTFEQGTNYCLEAINAVQWLAEKHEAETGAKPTIAIVTRAGDYGQDAAAGAKYAAAKLGLEVVYDGEATIVRGQDKTPIISAILGANPDWVWITSAPSETGEIMGGAVSQGFTGQWTGSVPSYDYRMLDSPLAPALQGFYWQTAYNVTWGTDVPGMQQISEVLTAAYPDRRPSDAFVLGWNEAVSMEQILRRAAANGDLTRQGVIDAAKSIEKISFNGTTPDFNYKGEPNDYVVREIYILKPNAERYAAAGGADQKLSDGLGTTGSDLVKGPFTTSLAADFNFTGACWTAEAGNTIGNG